MYPPGTYLIGSQESMINAKHAATLKRTSRIGDRTSLLATGFIFKWTNNNL